ncbi:MAG: serine/threonine protein kinase [Planctomycetaceae bacterium]
MADKDKDKTATADENKIDHYVKLGLIAMGKHAQVWEVQEENTTNRFAMKLLLPEAMLDPEQVTILKFEGKVAQSLDHPNIIKWIATVHRKTNVYLILELFKAHNIKNYLMADTVGVHTRIRKFIDSTCLALHHMHEKGWIHLDVKPDNILMNRSSEVRVIDFSLSDKVKGALGKMFGGKKEIGGTLTYIAPESIKKEAATPQTDIYSLGITIYECLTGTTPYKGTSPKDLLMKHLMAVPAPPSHYNKNVTPEMDRMVLRMIAKKPKDRQKNMQEVMSEFRNVQPFKEDPEKIREQQLEKAKAEAHLPNISKRLDSRTDHSRSEKAKADPEYAKTLPVAPAAPPPKAAPPEPAKKAPAAATKPTPPAAPRPAPPPMPMPMPMPPMMPGFAPQMPFAPMPMPMPQMMPGQFPQMPGYPGTPMQMPGYGAGGPMPGMPPMQMPMQPAAMMPQQGIPQPGMPGAPPQMPMAMNQPAPPQAVPVPPAAPVPARPSAGSVVRPGQRPEPPPSAKNVDDLPTMDELPDVM